MIKNRPQPLPLSNLNYLLHDADAPAVGPYTCKYCGAPSWYEPIDQTPPADYCHPEDHGSEEE